MSRFFIPRAYRITLLRNLLSRTARAAIAMPALHTLASSAAMETSSLPLTSVRSCLVANCSPTGMASAAALTLASEAPASISAS